MGALLGLLCLPALPAEGPAAAAFLAAAVVLASLASGRAEILLGTHDDPRIVIDETVGFWTAAAWLPREPAAILFAFVLFRFFDAVKFAPYRWLERLPGGWGVVMDDVGAGVAANLSVRALLLLRPA